MKVTGSQFKQAIKTRQVRLRMLIDQFPQALMFFEGDEGRTDPMELEDEITILEGEVIKLQTAQALYNSRVNLEVDKERVTLAEAIKRAGFATKMIALWKLASNNRNFDHRSVREKDHVYAVPSVSVDEIRDKIVTYTSLESQYNAAIARGNLEEVEMQDLNPELFDE